MSNIDFKNLDVEHKKVQLSADKWYKKLSLAAYLCIVVGSVMILGFFALSYFSFDSLKKSKVQDTSAIVFLELESQSNAIVTLAADLTAAISEYRPEEILGMKTFLKPKVIMDYTNLKNPVHVAGAFEDYQKMYEIPIARTKRFKYFFIEVEGVAYIAKVFVHQKKRYVGLWKYDLPRALRLSQRLNEDSLVYIVTRQGDLVYSNNFSITSRHIMRREALKRISSSPLAKAQFKITQGREDLIAFFSDVPATNLLFVAETNVNFIVEAILFVVKDFSIVSVILIYVIIFILFFLIKKIMKPFNGLMRLANEVGKGNFNVEPVTGLVGEMAYLSDSLVNMASNLQLRDERIKQLMIEQRHKDHLEGELEIARQIQANFLPNAEELASFSGDFTFKYTPAEEVAGDWFGAFYDEEKDEQIVIIADVSGHGAGSSMFTAILAGLFADLRESPGEKDYIDWMTRVNRAFKGMGRRKWHCTLQIARFQDDYTKVVFHNAGHPFPTYVRNSKDKVAAKRVTLPSSPLGLVDDPQLTTKEVKMKGDETYVFYSDGIIELKTPPPELKEYGPKKLVKTIQSAADLSPKTVLATLEASAKAHQKTWPQDDDICIICIKGRRKKK